MCLSRVTQHFAVGRNLPAYKVVRRVRAGVYAPQIWRDVGLQFRRRAKAPESHVGAVGVGKHRYMLGYHSYRTLSGAKRWLRDTDDDSGLTVVKIRALGVGTIGRQDNSVVYVSNSFVIVGVALTAAQVRAFLK